MEFNEVVSSRRSIRKYQPVSVPADKTARIMEAARLAPTGNNRQPFKFYVVSDPGKRQEIAARACHQEFIKEAPLIVAACIERADEFRYNAAIAIDHLVLAATNEGLGTCWIGWFEPEIVRTILNIPEDLDVVNLVTIGYAAENPDPRPRKVISDLVVEV